MKNKDVDHTHDEVAWEDSTADASSQNHDWENDPVWDLLHNGKPIQASEGFVDNVLHAIHAESSPVVPWWTSGRKYVAALLTAAACLVAYLMIPNHSDRSDVPIAGGETNQTPEVVETFADLQAVTDQEMLLAAVDHLHDFSDTELVTLIGL